jgi:hypothetical protein
MAWYHTGSQVTFAEPHNSSNHLYWLLYTTASHLLASETASAKHCSPARNAMLCLFAEPKCLSTAATPRPAMATTAIIAAAAAAARLIAGRPAGVLCPTQPRPAVQGSCSCRALKARHQLHCPTKQPCTMQHQRQQQERQQAQEQEP